jgi:hypothetical protein
MSSPISQDGRKFLNNQLNLTCVHHRSSGPLGGECRRSFNSPASVSPETAQVAATPPRTCSGAHMPPGRVVTAEFGNNHSAASHGAPSQYLVRARHRPKGGPDQWRCRASRNDDIYTGRICVKFSRSRTSICARMRLKKSYNAVGPLNLLTAHIAAS